MQYLLTSNQMKDLDTRTIGEFGLPSRVLMETAGKGCAEVIAEHFRDHLEGGACILCGTGNNGGDGAVIARWLHTFGYDVSILYIGDAKKASAETKANLDLCRNLDIPLENIAGQDDLPLLMEMAKEATLVVDAIFGIGFKGRLKPWLDDLFSIVNSYADFIVAVDIPSGLDADNGFCENAIYADATIAIESLKLGHVIGYGSEACGELHTVPIGIPSVFYNSLDMAKLFLDEDFLPPVRYPQTHKNDYGKVYVFGGIPGFTGASVLAARAALRAGCGYAFVLHRLELMSLYAIKLTEALYAPIPENPKTGQPDSRTLIQMVSDAGAILIGPGLGRDAYALKLLETILNNVKAPLVVDADAISLIADNPDLFKYLAKPNILLTPHWGEFARLAGIDKNNLEKDCLKPLRDFVSAHKVRILLKSHYTIYQDEQETWINVSGNDGLATGGSGDVLAGIITSFLAQGLEISEAAISASYLLGHTAEEVAEIRGTASILPSDIIENLFVGSE
jgi:NAD(P)H-hydrate epimerase